MTLEEKSLLERTYALVEENNSMLRKMRRAGRFSAIVRGVYWLVIIGITVGAYYYLQPYLASMMGIISAAQTEWQKASGTIDQAQNALNGMKGAVNQQ